jgi:hypothetical protein
MTLLAAAVSFARQRRAWNAVPADGLGAFAQIGLGLIILGRGAKPLKAFAHIPHTTVDPRLPAEARDESVRVLVTCPSHPVRRIVLQFAVSA